MGDKIDYFDAMLTIAHKKGNLFLAGKFDHSEPVKSKGQKCECGGEFETEYGFCKYGLGSFNRCTSCLSVYDFNEDPG